jgi:hypothetical protein
MKQKSAQELGREHVARLENYLASVNVIPTRMGRVNATAIARTCGFDRQVLYKNPAARALLASAAEASGFTFGEESPRESPDEPEGAEERSVPVTKLREAERRAAALEKRVSELSARNAALTAQLRRMDVIADELIGKGRRGMLRPGSSAPL